MKFPVLKAKSVHPRKPLCPWCRENKVMEPHSMAILAGGALCVVDAKQKSAEMATDCIGFLDLVWHGAHDSGTGAHREVYAQVPLAKDTPAGQFEFYFYSTRCLRAFLHAWVDQLDDKIQRAVRKPRRLPKK